MNTHHPPVPRSLSRTALRLRSSALLCIALVAAVAAGPAEAHGRRSGTSIGIGLSFDLGSRYHGHPGGYPYDGWRDPYWRHGGGWYQPWGATVYVPVPADAWVDRPVRTQAPHPAPPPPPPKPDPVIEPRRGQSAQQTEIDRQDCNRWATTQQAAMNDSDTFNRTVEACLAGRGYGMR